MVGDLEEISDLDAADSASRFWIGTTRPDGRPHTAAVGITWDDGKFYLVNRAGDTEGEEPGPRCGAR